MRNIIFISLLLIIGFNINIMYINEEFLLFLTLSIFFFLIYKNFHKSINLFFFFRIEFIYLTFLYLIKSNKYLSTNLYQILKLVKLKLKKLDFLILISYYKFNNFNLKLASIINLNILISTNYFLSYIMSNTLYKFTKVNFFNLYLNTLNKFLLNYE